MIFVPPLLILFFPETVGQKIEDATTLDLMNLFYVIAFVWVTSVAFILTDFAQHKRNIREDKKDHAKDISSIFNFMTDIGVRISINRKNPDEIFEELKIILPTKEGLLRRSMFLKGDFQMPEPHHDVELDYLRYHDEYYYYNESMEHLKKYKDTYKHWEKTINLIDKFNQEKTMRDNIKGMLAVKMKEGFNLTSKCEKETDSSIYYDSSIIDRILQAMYSPEQYHFKDLEKTHTDQDYTWIIPKMGQSPFVVSKQDIDLDKFIQLLKSFVDNESLKTKYDEENKKLEEINNELEQFKTKIKQLIKEIKYNPLKRACKSCPK